MPRNHVDGGLLTQQPSTVYLGIDPSLTGFAVTYLAQHGPFESWVYTSKQRGVERLIDIVDWLDEKNKIIIRAGHVVKDIAIEDGVFHSQSAAVLGELSAVVRLWAWELGPINGQYPIKVPPTVVKKFATDKGNAKKNEVMLAVYKKWGVEFADDNMSDSYVIARICRGLAETMYEQAVLDKMIDSKFRDPARV